MIRHFKTTRLKRKIRSKFRIRGTANRPRVAVFRSHRWLFVQIIDDERKTTILSRHDKKIAGEEKNKIKRGLLIGKIIAEDLSKKKIKTVVFDRSGYSYHGRIKAVAEGLREGGIKV